MKKYDIGYGHLGNGLTVWNRAEERSGDYVKIAHISPERHIVFYESLPLEIVERIREIARTDDGNISATQSQKIFSTPPTTNITSAKLEFIYTVHYVDGQEVQVNEEDFNTAIADIQGYTAEDRKNPYSIKKITVKQAEI